MSPPTHPALQEISHLDVSSPDYPHQLNEVLYGPEYLQCFEKLGKADQRWLVGYLDEALGRIEVSYPVSRKCLRELKTLCRTNMILPLSYRDLSQQLSVEPYPTSSGGFGDIFEGTLEGSRVCVKRLRATKDCLTEVTKTSYGQAAIWKHLNHPNILPLLGITATRPVRFISRWAAGGELGKYLIDHPNANRLNLLYDVAKGLDYLHSRGVIHGDLKGQNILVDIVDQLPRACLADFDVTAVTKNPVSKRPHTQQKSWSVPWSSPEVLEGGEPSREGDVYSFAMVMIEVFINETPFGGVSEYLAATAIMKGERHPRPTNPVCTEILWSLINDCWKQEPHLRPEISGVSKVLASVLPLRN